MKGLELARAFYNEYGAPMLEREFPELLPCLCVGLVGSGSECYGYDDAVSQDHDFEPGFCIFIPDESVTGENGRPLVDSRAEFRLSRAYAALPKEFCGYDRNLISPVGGSRHGVIRIGDFYKKTVGAADGVLEIRDWLSLPEYALAEAVNGEVFFDNYGAFSAIRESLRRYPRDIFLKKLAGYLLIMEQAGLYNYPRCLAHGETAAAQLAAGEFVRAAMHVIFLLNDTYMPFYKWSFRMLRSLPLLASLALPLEDLLTTPNTTEKAAEKSAAVKSISIAVAEAVATKGLATDISDSSGSDAGPALTRLAYAVNDLISDPTIRTMNILCGVE